MKLCVAAVREKAAQPAIVELKTCWLDHVMIVANPNDAVCAPFRLASNRLFPDLFGEVVLNTDLLDQFKL